MAKTLSEDLRCRVIVAVDAGMSRRAAAERFGVAVASAVRWVHEWRTAGASSAKPKGGDQRSHRIEAYSAVILAAIEAQVDITLVELAELLRRDHRVSFSPSTIWRFLDRHAITIKKTAHASEQARSDVAARRRAWFDSQPELDPEHLVFIDGRAQAPSVRAQRPTVLPQKWRVSAGVPNVVSVVVHPFRTAIGRPPRSPARCGCVA